MNPFHWIGRDPRRTPRRFVILTSGSIRSGKTTLAQHLKPKLHAELIRTKGILIAEYGAHPQVRLRSLLQELGEQLDKETDGVWVAAATSRRMDNTPRRQPLIIDSVRIAKQIQHLRGLAGVRIIHVHLRATSKKRKARYEETTRGDESELPSYEDLLKSETEKKVDDLRKHTWLRFNTTVGGAALFAWIVAAVVWGLRALETARTLAVAFILGAVLGALACVPIFLFWFDHLDPYAALLLGSFTAVFFSVLVGSALTRLSPIERDIAERPSGPPWSPVPDRATPPAGPEVLRARAPVQQHEG